MTNANKLFVYKDEGRTLVTVISPQLDQGIGVSEHRVIDFFGMLGRRAKILSFALYGNIKKPILGVLLDVQGNFHVHSAELANFNQESS